MYELREQINVIALHFNDYGYHLNLTHPGQLLMPSNTQAFGYDTEVLEELFGDVSDIKLNLTYVYHGRASYSGFQLFGTPAINYSALPTARERMGLTVMETLEIVEVNELAHHVLEHKLDFTNRDTRVEWSEISEVQINGIGPQSSHHVHEFISDAVSINTNIAHVRLQIGNILNSLIAEENDLTHPTDNEGYAYTESVIRELITSILITRDQPDPFTVSIERYVEAVKADATFDDLDDIRTRTNEAARIVNLLTPDEISFIQDEYMRIAQKMIKTIEDSRP